MLVSPASSCARCFAERSPLPCVRTSSRMLVESTGASNGNTWRHSSARRSSAHRTRICEDDFSESAATSVPFAPASASRSVSTPSRPSKRHVPAQAASAMR